MNNRTAFIQARTSSTRFRGKVLQPLGGVPMIIFMVQRVRQSGSLDNVVVVTSEDSSDDPLARVLEDGGIPHFRGDLHDVLGRYLAAAQKFDVQRVVRLTGDCPLIDPHVIDEVVSLLESSGADYVSNVDPPTYPDGLDVEAFTRAALERAAAAATAIPDREHVTLWMRSEASGLIRKCKKNLIDSSHIRLTVDYPEDLEMVRRIVDVLGPNPDQFAILRHLDRHPYLLEISQHVRNEGLAAQFSGT